MRRLVFGFVIALGLYYAVQGGEYSTVTLFRQKTRTATLSHSIDSLQRDVDSLSRLERLIRTDPATQERIAREEYGMTRGDHELLYRFVERDTSKSSRR